MAVEYPYLTLRERDRRFELARKLMEEKNLDVLIVGQNEGRIFQYFGVSQQYFSNEPNGQNMLVVIPRDSDPVLLALRTHWGQIWCEHQAGTAQWIEDFRSHEGKNNVVGVLKEKGLERGRAGLILPGAGGGGYNPRALGSLGDPLWRWVSEELPEMEAEDVAMAMSLAATTKSEEELGFARYTAEVSDRAAQAFADAAHIGGTEIDMYAAAMHEFVDAGIDCQNILIILGNEPAGMGAPRWLFPNGPTRKLRAGDVVMNEMFPSYGGIETQLSLSVHVGEPSKEALIAHKACQDAHAACMDMIKPGVSFQQVWQAMFDVVKAADCWNWNPLIHSLSPMALVGQQFHDLDKQEALDPVLRYSVWPPRVPPQNETLLEEGMMFSIEPGAAYGTNRSRTGCLGVVTADGGEEYTSVGTRLHIVE